MPTRDAHLQFQAWAEQYGPVYSLILGTKTMIVLSSHEAVKGMFLSQMARHRGRPIVLTESPKNFLIAVQLYTGNQWQRYPQTLVANTLKRSPGCIPCGNSCIKRHEVAHNALWTKMENDPQSAAFNATCHCGQTLCPLSKPGIQTDAAGDPGPPRGLDGKPSALQ